MTQPAWSRASWGGKGMGSLLRGLCWRIWALAREATWPPHMELSLSWGLEAGHCRRQQGIHARRGAGQALAPFHPFGLTQGCVQGQPSSLAEEPGDSPRHPGPSPWGLPLP